MAHAMTETRPLWMQGFIPNLDRRNPRADDPSVLKAVQHAETAKTRYLAACDRVQRLTSA